MRSPSTRFTDAVRYSHQVVVEADVWKSKRGWYPLEVVSGEVSLTSNIVRSAFSLRVVLNDQTDPTLLSPISGFVQIRRGIKYADGTSEFVSLGVFRIYTYDTDNMYRGQQTVLVSGFDLMRSVSEARLVRPKTFKGNSAKTMLSDTVWEGVGLGTPLPYGNTVWGPGIDDESVRAFYVERERTDVITRLMTLLAVEVYFDGIGRLRVNAVPPVSTNPVATITHDNSLLKARYNLSREQLYNAVSVTSTRTDGTKTITKVAYDTGVYSPTRWNGPFGNVPLFYSSPLLVTAAQCERAAKAMLSRRVGTHMSLSLDLFPNPALEPGDLIQVESRSGIWRVVIDSIQFPLSPAGSIRAEVRNVFVLEMPLDSPIPLPSQTWVPTEVGTEVLA